VLRVLIVLAVVVVAVLRGGSLRAFATLRLRYIPLVLGGFLLQLLIFPLTGDGLLPAQAIAPLYLLSMALLVWWVWLNRHLPGILLIGSGVVMNLAAIAANGGVMPIDPDAAAYAGKLALAESEVALNNSLPSDDDVRLWLLTDIFPVPAGIPFATVYSLGDVLLTTGIGILCARTMFVRPPAVDSTKGAPDDQRLPAT
jgi:hypothetical protein